MRRKKEMSKAAFAAACYEMYTFKELKASEIIKKYHLWGNAIKFITSIKACEKLTPEHIDNLYSQLMELNRKYRAAAKAMNECDQVTFVKEDICELKSQGVEVKELHFRTIPISENTYQSLSRIAHEDFNKISEIISDALDLFFLIRKISK